MKRWITHLTIATGVLLGTNLCISQEVPELKLPAVDGPKPWNDRPVLNAPGRFQFAVMTDNTGGHRPGVWLNGIRHVNLLRPAFVVSVGDLIEGYTTNRVQIEAQWKEFLADMDQIQMKFFFVPGNHDLANPVMHEIWRAKFGREWYSFDYQGVHFVCLSSEDPRETHMSDEQVEWAIKDLGDHADARWTFVFMHKPLWLSAESAIAAGNEDTTNWKRVEDKLKDRPHTVFAGHVHHYVQYDRNGTNYYHLGTTGGGSQLRGIPYGEFDHVTWVSMEADGPRVAHVMLGGVLAPDVVTEKGIARFRQFLSQAVVRVVPVLGGSNDTLTSGTIQIQVANHFDTPLRLVASIQNLPLRGLTLSPERVEYEAAQGDERTLAVEYSFSEPVSVEQFAGASLLATVRSVEKQPLQAEFSLPIIIDRQLPCPRIKDKIIVDGKLEEWQLVHKTSRRPVMFGDTKNWNGPGDASLAFNVGYDDTNLYVAAHVTDDRVRPDQDRFYIRLDARPIADRIARPEHAAGCFRIEGTPPEKDGPWSLKMEAYGGSSVHPITQAAYRKSPKGYDVEFAIPLENITDVQGADWSSFQLTAGLADVDDEGPAYILWRGTPDVLAKNTNFAHFRRE